MKGIRLGSIFGVEIRIDYSWFIIFFLILWTLTSGVFPATYPGLSTGAHIGMGFAATVLFFASLLAHELSHSLVARRRGMPVQGITLFIFGGMARAGGEFDRPEDEFVVAGVGPLASIIIAGLFAFIAWAGARAGITVAVTAVASWLAFINIVLAVFNLFPGFPLDGGRLFRAAIWKRTGDPLRATRIATNGGKLLGYLLMILGLLNLFGGNPIGGLWLLFIGWFVRMAADTSYRQYVLRESLESVRARDMMTPAPMSVTPDITLQQFVEEHVLEGRHHSYPVVRDGDEPVGLVTLDRARTVPRAEWASRTVADVMVPADDELMVGGAEDMSRALDKLGRSPVRRLLVTEGGRLAGIISHTDVARWLEREQLRAEIDGNGGRRSR